MARKDSVRPGNRYETVGSSSAAKTGNGTRLGKIGKSGKGGKTGLNNRALKKGNKSPIPKLPL